MSSKIRIASGLLLAYPALTVIANSWAALVDQWPGHLLDGLLLVLVLSVVGVHLRRGREWAYTSALVCSGGFAVIMVLYELAIASLWGREAWADWPTFGYAFHYAPLMLFASSFALLALDSTLPGARRRAVTFAAVALGMELVLMALIARFGIGSVFGPRSWNQLALGLSQVPGEILLSQMRMCCGYSNHTIISDWIDPHWGGITRQGIPTLVAANTVGLVGVLAIARSLLMRVRHVRGPAHAAAAAPAARG
ncbi:MAG TPA: hypothetical protein VGX50_15860 [Longimicrobium sp.]|jgi:hypothetical protein|nr:hypothetical protein [Longimicrobium sp.]